MAAISSVVNLLKHGDHIVAMEELYGGAKKYFSQIVTPNFNINISYVDLTDPGKVCFGSSTFCITVALIKL